MIRGALGICPGGAVVRLVYHAVWYGMGVGAPQACSGPKMGCVAKHSKGRYASCDEHRSHTRGHSEERDQKSGVLWHENEKIQPPQFGRASGQTRDLGDIGYRLIKKKSFPRASGAFAGHQRGEPPYLFGDLLSSTCHLPPIGDSNPPTAQMS